MKNPIEFDSIGFFIPDVPSLANMSFLLKLHGRITMKCDKHPRYLLHEQVICHLIQMFQLLRPFAGKSPFYGFQGTSAIHSTSSYRPAFLHSLRRPHPILNCNYDYLISMTP